METILFNEDFPGEDMESSDSSPDEQVKDFSEDSNSGSGANPQPDRRVGNEPENPEEVFDPNSPLEAIKNPG